MKRIFLLICSFVILVSLCACDGSGNRAVNNEAAGTSSTDTSDTDTNNTEAEAEAVYISAVKSLPEEYEKFSVSNEYVTDMNYDGVDDKILLYTDAEPSVDGFNKNDGNVWSLVVTDGADQQNYILFRDYVQLGNVYFQVADYFKDGKPVPKITFYESTGAGLRIMNFTYSGNKGFLMENIYDSSEKSESGINLKYSSIPVN